MSGFGEALAIVSCVAGLIQAYDAAARRIEKIKKRRAQRDAPPPPVPLEISVERGKQQIIDVIKEGKERFGGDFEHGDDEVQIALMRITIATQAELLEGLAAGREDDDSVDFWKCIDASDTGRRQALIVLNEYIMRKTKEKRAAAETPAQDVPDDATMQTEDGQVQQTSRPLQPVQRWNTMATLQDGPSPPAHDTLKSRFFSFSRSSTLVNEPPPPQTTRPAPVLCSPIRDVSEVEALKQATVPVESLADGPYPPKDSLHRASIPTFIGRAPRAISRRRTLRPRARALPNLPSGCPPSHRTAGVASMLITFATERSIRVSNGRI